MKRPTWDWCEARSSHHMKGSRAEPGASALPLLIPLSAAFFFSFTACRARARARTVPLPGRAARRRFALRGFGAGAPAAELCRCGNDAAPGPPAAAAVSQGGGPAAGRRGDPVSWTRRPGEGGCDGRGVGARWKIEGCWTGS